MMRLRHFVALLAGAVASLTAFSAQAQTKFAVVDIQRAVAENEDGLRAQAQLKKYFDKRQQELDAKQTELQKQREDIEKQSKVLSQQALAKRTEDWQRQALELQGVFVEYNKELQKKQNELQQPIYTKLMTVLRKLATQDGLDAILEKQAVPWARIELDVTDKIIQLYNGTAGGAPATGSAAPAPAPAAPPAAPQKK